jgi:hypothetical protein
VQRGLDVVAGHQHVDVVGRPQPGVPVQLRGEQRSLERQRPDVLGAEQGGDMTCRGFDREVLRTGDGQRASDRGAERLRHQVRRGVDRARADQRQQAALSELTLERCEVRSGERRACVCCELLAASGAPREQVDDVKQ